MKPRNIILVIIISILCIESYAQDSNHKNYVNINFISFLSPYHKVIDLSIGREISKMIHFEIGYSIILAGGDWGTDPVGREEDTGGIVKLETKFVIFQITDGNNDLLNHFISLKKYRTWHNYVSLRYKDLNSDDISKYNVSSKVFGLIPQYGFFIQENRLHFEASAGYGIRKLQITNDYSGDIDSLSKQYRLNERFEPEKNGVYYRGSIALSFKFGFRF